MKNQRHCHDDRGKSGGGIEQLLCRNAGIFAFLPPKILRCDDCAAGRKRREHLNKQDIDGIHQGDSRHSGFPHARDHDGIRHADRNSQQLLDHERDQQPYKRMVREKQWIFKYARRAPVWLSLTHTQVPPLS